MKREPDSGNWDMVFSRCLSTRGLRDTFLPACEDIAPSEH